MREHFLRAGFAVSAAAGASVALCLGAAGASASVGGNPPHRATPQCVAGSSHCVTWQEDHGGVAGLAISATGGFVNAPVLLAQADTSDPSQDFIVTEFGKVSAFFNGGNNDLGLNAYDNTNYANDMLVGAEYAPGGVPSDLCLANVNDKLVLRDCNGRRWQTFIEATSTQDGAGYGGGNPLSVSIPSGFTMLLSVARVFDNGQHLAMTGASVDGAQPTFTHPHQSNVQFWTPVVEP